MEVNERVITMLFSSAVGSATVRPQNLESSESTAQVMPMVAKCRCSSENQRRVPLRMFFRNVR